MSTATAFEQEVKRQLPRFVACSLTEIQEPRVWDDGSIGQSFKFETVAGKPSSFYHSFSYRPEYFQKDFRLAKLNAQERDAYTRNMAGVPGDPEKNPFCGSFLQVLFDTPENLGVFLEKVRSSEITAASVYQAFNDAVAEGLFNPQFGSTLQQKVEPVVDEDGNIRTDENGRQEWIPKKGWRVKAKTYKDDPNKNKLSGFFWLTEKALEKIERQIEPNQYGDVYCESHITADMLP